MKVAADFLQYAALVLGMYAVKQLAGSKDDSVSLELPGRFGPAVSVVAGRHEADAIFFGKGKGVYKPGQLFIERRQIQMFKFAIKPPNDFTNLFGIVGIVVEFGSVEFKPGLEESGLANGNRVMENGIVQIEGNMEHGLIPFKKSN